MKRRHLLSLVAAATLPARPVAAQPVAVTATEVSLYAGPGNSYPEVLRLTPRVPVKVHACMPDYAWCEVSYLNDRGWAFASSLTYQDRGAMVPLALAAAGAGIPVSGFEIESYWGMYYTGRPWYGDRHRWQNRPDARPPSSPPGYRPPGIGLRLPSELPSRPAGAPIGGAAAEPRGQGLSR